MAPMIYSIPQRFIHWAVALLVLFNLLFPDGMNAWHHIVRRGETPSADDIASANIHAYVGIAILVLAVIRLALRVTSGVPAAPEGQPKAFHLLAAAAHFLLYALIFIMPITGIAAYYFGIGSLGSLHADILKALLWTVIGAHVVGALAQHFYFRTNVLRRMTTG